MINNAINRFINFTVFLILIFSSKVFASVSIDPADRFSDHTHRVRSAQTEETLLTCDQAIDRLMQGIQGDNRYTKKMAVRNAVMQASATCFSKELIDTCKGLLTLTMNADQLASIVRVFTKKIPPTLSKEFADTCKTVILSNRIRAGTTDDSRACAILEAMTEVSPECYTPGFAGFCSDITIGMDGLHIVHAIKSLVKVPIDKYSEFISILQDMSSNIVNANEKSFLVAALAECFVKLCHKSAFVETFIALSPAEMYGVDRSCLLKTLADVSADVISNPEFARTCITIFADSVNYCERRVVVTAVAKLKPRQYQLFVDIIGRLKVNMKGRNCSWLTEKLSDVSEDILENPAFLSTCMALVIPGMDQYQLGYVVEVIARLNPGLYEFMKSYIRSCPEFLKYVGAQDLHQNITGNMTQDGLRIAMDKLSRKIPRAIPPKTN